MSAGLPVNADQINVNGGDICRAVAQQLRRATNFKRFLDGLTPQDMAAAFPPLTVDDATTIKSAFGQLAEVDATFQGNRSFVDRLAGLGDV